MSTQPDLLRVWENKRQLLVLELKCKAAELLDHMGGENVGSFSAPFQRKDVTWNIDVRRMPK